MTRCVTDSIYIQKTAVGTVGAPTCFAQFYSELMVYYIDLDLLYIEGLCFDPIKNQLISAIHFPQHTPTQHTCTKIISDPGKG
jgi:hypothetical protein